MRKLYLVLCTVAILSFALNEACAQIIGVEGFLQGTHTEVGVTQCGSFGTAALPPAGYHHTGVGSGVTWPMPAGRGLGFVCDAGKNGWGVAGPGALPLWCGDYFLPGSPSEGWGIQIGATSYTNSNASTICQAYMIPGGLSSYTVGSDYRSVTWSGAVAGVSVNNTTYVPDSGAYFVTKVQLCNTTSSPLYNTFYVRNVDPDNEQPWSGNYTTNNVIRSQGSSTTYSLVTAAGLAFNCYLGIGSIDPRSRVSYGGFFMPTTLSDIWYATGGYVGTVGSSRTRDEAISIAFKIDTLLPGECECFAYAHVLSATDLAAAIGATESYSFTAGSVDITDSLTAHICYGDTLTVTAVGPAGYTWTWSPNYHISDTVGATVRVWPDTTTTYTATATGPCGSAVFNIRVIVDTLLKHYSINPDTTICMGANANLWATGGNTWSWTPASTLGTPTNDSTTASPLGTTTYNVHISSTTGCSVDTFTTVYVDTLRADAGPDTSTCRGGSMILGAPPLTDTTIVYSWTGIPSSATAYLDSTDVPNPMASLPPALTGYVDYVLTISHYGCVASDTMRLFIQDLPVSILNLDSLYCVQDAAHTLHSSSDGGTYSGPGIVSDTIFNPALAGVGGPYQITYYYDNPLTGCISRDTVYTYVAGPTVPSISGLDSQYCIYDAADLLSGTPVGGVFSGPGILANSFIPNAAGVGGPYMIVYTYTDPVTGCVAADSQYTKVNDRPVVDIVGLDSMFCNYNPLVVLAATPPGGTFSGPGVSSGNLDPKILPPGGPYWIRYDYTDPVTGCSNVDSQAIYINDRPLARISGLDTSYCSYEGSDTLVGTIHGGTFSGPGITDSVFTPSAAGVGGPYLVIYTVVDPATTCYNADTQATYVNARPVVSFSGLDSLYCNYEGASLLTGSPIGGVFSGPGIVGNSFVPTAVSIGGPYKIVYTYTDPSTTCINADTQYTYVTGRPIVRFSGLSSTYCEYDADVTLSGAPAGGVFAGMGIIPGNIFSPTTAGAGGPYLITYTYVDPATDCENIDSQYVDVLPTPAVTYSGLPGVMCIDASPVSLVGSPSGGTFSGPGINLGNRFTPGIAGVGGPYAIVYEYTNPVTGCFNSDTQYVTVVALPTPAISGLDFAYCIDAPADSIIGAPAGGTFSGIGMLGNFFHPDVAGVGGPYSIQYTYTDANGCTNFTNRTTSVNPLPIANAGQDDTICLGLNTTLNASGGIGYEWSNGILTASNTVAPTITTTYTVTVTDANGCLNSDDVRVVVTYNELTLGTDSVSCNGYHDGKAFVQASTGTAPYIYIWNDIDAQVTDTAFGLIAGLYSVTVTDNKGCQGTASINVYEPNRLNADWQITDILCNGDSTGSISFTGTGGTPPYGFSLTQDHSHFVSGETISHLWAGVYDGYMIDANKCVYQFEIEIKEPTAIVLTPHLFEPNCYAYADGSIFIDAIGGTPPYAYEFDNGQTSSNGWFYNLVTGLYNLTVRDNNGCVIKMPLPLDEPEPIIVNVIPDTIQIALGGRGQFMIEFTGVPEDSVEIVWSPSEGLNCTDCRNPQINTYTDQIYTVSVIDIRNPNNLNPCHGTAIGYVYVDNGIPIYIPNAFTPNADGQNDVFYVYGEQIKNVRLTVFDRWGEKLFDASQQNVGWDGTYKGKLLNPGVYIYAAEIEYLNGLTSVKTGSVTLIR